MDQMPILIFIRVMVVEKRWKMNGLVVQNVKTFFKHTIFV
jgi:hypothetical protein